MIMCRVALTSFLYFTKVDDYYLIRIKLTFAKKYEYDNSTGRNKNNSYIRNCYVSVFFMEDIPFVATGERLKSKNKNERGKLL